MCGDDYRDRSLQRPTRRRSAHPWWSPHLTGGAAVCRGRHCLCLSHLRHALDAQFQHRRRGNSGGRIDSRRTARKFRQSHLGSRASVQASGDRQIAFRYRRDHRGAIVAGRSRCRHTKEPHRAWTTRRYRLRWAVLGCATMAIFHRYLLRSYCASCSPSQLTRRVVSHQRHHRDGFTTLSYSHSGLMAYNRFFMSNLHWRCTK